MCKWSLLAIVGAAAMAGAASASTITTLDGSQGWFPFDVRTGGTLEISSEQPRSGNGSLKLASTDAFGTSQAKSGAIFGLGFDSQGNPIPLGSLASLVDGGNVGMEYFRDASSNTLANRAPALKLHVRNSQGDAATLIWEQVYNGGGAVATNTWVDVDATGGNFWMFDGTVRESFNITLTDWLTGASVGDSTTIDSGTQVVGLEVGIGSGWNGEFLGYVDNVRLSFAGGADFSFNFETESVIIPLPTGAGLAGLGLGLVALRRRR